MLGGVSLLSAMRRLLSSGGGCLCAAVALVTRLACDYVVAAWYCLLRLVKVTVSREYCQYFRNMDTSRRAEAVAASDAL